MAEVAVITTCFNQKRVIEDAITSVLEQEYDNGVCHVIADDGSNDGSVELLRQWEAVTDSIKVVQCTNRGPAGAFNAALLNVPPEAEYVVTLCGDDWLAPNFVRECLLKFTFNPGADVVVPGMVVHGNPHGETHLRLVPQQQPTLAEVWAWDPPRMWCTAMFRKSVLLEAGGFHCGAYGEEDWDMWIDLTARGKTFAFTDKTWFYYRYSDFGLTATKTREEWNDHRAEIMRHHRGATLPGPDMV